jgi:hypothetical protein
MPYFVSQNEQVLRMHTLFLAVCDGLVIGNPANVCQQSRSFMHVKCDVCGLYKFV